MEKNTDYVDVRGPYPTYVKGVKAVNLPGKKRDLTVEDARIVALIMCHRRLWHRSRR
jgi:hypothetical protein